MPQLVIPRAADVDGLPVKRVLPRRERRCVGPFCFLDEMGPVTLAAGEGMDVRPHPHIGLATLTYLLSGELVHRDSLGCTQTIVPGDVNWMTAGRGVTHSERTGDAARAREFVMHGVQAWVALPPESEDAEPAFRHQEAASLPVVEVDGVSLRVLVGEAFGAESPVPVHTPLFYVDAVWSAPGEVVLDAALGERALWPLAGACRVGGEVREPGALVVLDDGEPATVAAEAGARVLLLGGARREAPLHMHWNYVASSVERIEAAKARWAADGFPRVVGDDGPRAVDPRA